MCPTVLGLMARGEASETVLKLPPFLELFMSLSWDEVVGLEVLYSAGALGAVHVSHRLELFILCFG